MIKRLKTGLIGLIWTLPLVMPAAADFTSSQIQFFESKIRPMLAEKCYGCHSHKAKKLKGGAFSG